MSMPNGTLNRRDFVRALLVDRNDLIVVSGLGSTTYDVAAAGDHPLNLYQWGGMGGTAMIGLGVALARPAQRVVVLTGDGDALMGLGSLATIGVKQPHNLSVVVLDNGRYGETGMQASHTSAGVDLASVAKACGFAESHTMSDMHRAPMMRALVHQGRGPILIRACIAREELPRVLPTRDGFEMRARFTAALVG
ncbi:MAG: aldehyde dehydrogenase [Gemmatimonadaceae bacterium]|nr:aldehyde dehydrogenase [Gemmatimonadaceae bacterium]